MKVCLDPGHGGRDPGAVGNGLLEKNLTLSICLELKPMLENNGISVILTREGDYSPGHLEGNQNGALKARVAIAEKNKVDLFVAVHINASGGTGEEILIVGKGGPAQTAANKVLPFLVSAGSWPNRGVKTQNVLVLRDTSMPAILTESGFIDHPMDAAKLKDPNFRHALAVAHAKGLCAYFGIQYKALQPEPPKPAILYRVILDGKQNMALSFQEHAISEVKKAVDSDKASRGFVQRSTDNVNIFEVTDPPVIPIVVPPITPPVGPSVITKSQPEPSLQTSVKTPIMGKETITLEQCQRFLSKNNPDALDIIPFYKTMGEQLGIRWGYALVQMMKETNYLKFGRDVLPAQNNFAGIGAVGGGAPGSTFSTPEEGVLAHLEHIYAYASSEPLPVGMPKVDPRFDLVKRGSCSNWEDLNGRWAVPGVSYGEEIVAIYGRIAAEVVELPQESSVELFILDLMEYLKNYQK